MCSLESNRRTTMCNSRVLRIRKQCVIYESSNTTILCCYQVYMSNVDYFNTTDHGNRLICEE
jgi:hypothetical protein